MSKPKSLQRREVGQSQASCRTAAAVANQTRALPLNEETALPRPHRPQSGSSLCVSIPLRPGRIAADHRLDNADKGTKKADSGAHDMTTL